MFFFIVYKWFNIYSFGMEITFTLQSHVVISMGLQ